MPKKKNLPLYLVKYHCISCQVEYQNYSTLPEEKKIETCANCSPAYQGTSSSTVRIGRAEKFYQRQQKTQAKKKLDN